MQLPSEETINNIGIDSCERAVVWSGLLLRYGYLQLDDSQKKNAFRVEVKINRISGGYKSEIEISATLYCFAIALLKGADILDSIQELTTDNHAYLGREIIPSEEKIIDIQPLQPNVISLEQYYYYNLSFLIEKTIDDNYANIQIFPSLKGIDNQLIELKTAVKIPFNPKHYLLSNNLVESVGIIVPTDTDTGNPDTGNGENSSLFGNDFLVGNNNVVGN